MTNILHCFMPRLPFSPKNYPDYTFRNGSVFRGNRRLKPTLNPTTNYSYYRLVNKNGAKAKVSTNFITGKIDPVGAVFYTDPPPELELYYPDAYPMYGVSNSSKSVFRIAFRYPRVNCVEVKPTEGGYLLHDFNMTPVVVSPDTLFY